MSGKAFVLVLGGGGAKGLSHLGVIKGILDSNLPIDAIAGSSVGAAVAACYASSLNYDQTLNSMRKLKEASIKSLRYSKFVWPVVALFSSDHLTRTLMQLMGDNLIEDLPIPYFAMVSDVKNKNAVVLKQGLIWEAIRHPCLAYFEEKLISIGYDEIIKAIHHYHEAKLYS